MVIRFAITYAFLFAAPFGTASSFPNLPGWQYGDECPDKFVQGDEISNNPFSASSSACTGSHDPTHMIGVDGNLVSFISGQGPPGCAIETRVMKKGTNKWVAGQSMFGSCDKNALPKWLKGIADNAQYRLGDFDAPGVTFDNVSNKWVMYYSVYIATQDAIDSEVEGDVAQACIGRATSDGRDPLLLICEDDDVPVFCSNVQYTTGGAMIPDKMRFDTELEYVQQVDDGYGIDPAIYQDDSGELYMTWGSGILHTVKLNKETGHFPEAAFLDDGSGPGKQDKDDPEYHVISVGATSEEGGEYFNEAPYVYKHGGYYYLFVNWYACCSGTCSTYEIRMGRSSEPIGPFLDKDGFDMAERDATTSYGMKSAGGSLLLMGDKSSGMIGPGHAGVFEYEEEGETVRVFTFHFYDMNDKGSAKLGSRVMTFDSDGWPVLDGDEWDPCRFTGCSGDLPTECEWGLSTKGEGEVGKERVLRIIIPSAVVICAVLLSLWFCCKKRAGKNQENNLMGVQLR